MKLIRDVYKTSRPKVIKCNKIYTVIRCELGAQIKN